MVWFEDKGIRIWFKELVNRLIGCFKIKGFELFGKVVWSKKIEKMEENLVNRDVVKGFESRLIDSKKNKIGMKIGKRMIWFCKKVINEVLKR